MIQDILNHATFSNFIIQAKSDLCFTEANTFGNFKFVSIKANLLPYLHKLQFLSPPQHRETGSSHSSVES